MLKKIWERWKTVARKIGQFNSRIILTVIYFLLFGPIFLIRKSASLLKLGTNRPDSYWQPRKTQDLSSNDMLRQY